MNFTDFKFSFDIFNYIALAGLLLSWLITSYLIEHPPLSRISVSELMSEYRREWMREFVTRQPRIFDATVIDSLRQATAFFASASMLALGGGLAVLGNSDQMMGLAQDFELTTRLAEIEIKMILVLLFLANAFLKFVWASRLFGYCRWRSRR